VAVPVTGIDLGRNPATALSESFEQLYRTIYGRTAEGNPIEAINWRVVASAGKPDLPIDRLRSRLAGDGASAIKGQRPIYLPERRGFVDVDVYDRYRLMPGTSFTGPAIVEERESTVVIGANALVTIDALSNLVVTMSGADSN
jgi:N-methylhydantoinase A